MHIKHSDLPSPPLPSPEHPNKISVPEWKSLKSCANDIAQEKEVVWHLQESGMWFQSDVCNRTIIVTSSLR